MNRSGHRSIPRVLFASILIIFLGRGCGAAASAQEGSLVVFAAASLKDALDEVNAAYRRDMGRETTTSYAASSTLAKQIEAAAPADIFISADLDWMDYLAKKNFDQSRDTSQPARQSACVDRAKQQHHRLGIAPNFPLAQALGNGRLAVADKGAKILGPFPDDTHPPIIYPIAGGASSTNSWDPSYIAYLRSPAAGAVFEKHGFTARKVMRTKSG